MPARRITSTRKTQTQNSYSNTKPLPEDESGSSVSDSGKSTVYPNIKTVGPSHAKTHASVSHRRAGSTRKMASLDHRRTNSDSRTYKRKDAGFVVHDVRRSDDTRQRHRSHRSQSRKSGDRRENLDVSKNTRGSSREVGHSSGLRRSKTTGATDRAKHERPYKEDRAPSRRHSEREIYRQVEKRHRTPLRRERRSLADNLTQSHQHEAPARSASVHVSKPSLLFLPFLHRSRTSAQKSPSTNISAREIPARNVYARHTSDGDIPRQKPTGHASRPSPQRSNLPAAAQLERSPTNGRGAKTGDRAPGFFEAFTGPPKPPRRQEAEKRVECVTCMDDFPISKCPKLPCNHRFCHDCLRRAFELSVTDSSHMPPKCCTSDNIPLELVGKLFDHKFKVKWNRKFQEFTTKNRIYCPAKGCGEWIKPRYIQRDTSGKETYGRKYAICKQCRTKVCCVCNNKWHSSRDCPKDAATRDFIKLAREKGWQRCHNCKAMVEHNEGCNHMTCKCGAQFCMVCGLQWKTCDCQMFSDEAVNLDRLVHLQGAIPLPNPTAAERAHLRRLREQQDRDEALARRLQELHMGRGRFDGYGPHFMDEDFVRQAAEALSAVFEPFEEEREQQRPNQAANNRVQEQPAIRQLDPALEAYNNNRPPGRQNERIVPRRRTTDYAAEAAIHQPVAVVREVRASQLAGMARGQVGDGRVEEWRRHVGPLS